VEYRKCQTIFVQGSASQSVLYLQRGRVKLTITSAARKEAVIAIMSEGEFFGEGCITGQRLPTATAIAMEPTSMLEIGKHEMIRVIHNESGFSDRFVSHMLARNVRIEEDLPDQLAQPAKGTVSPAGQFFISPNLPVRCSRAQLKQGNSGTARAETTRST